MGINELIAALTAGAIFGLAAWLLFAAIATVVETRSEREEVSAAVTYGPIVLSLIVGLVAAVMVSTGAIAK
jgi:hypothetical protein